MSGGGPSPRAPSSDGDVMGIDGVVPGAHAQLSLGFARLPTLSHSPANQGRGRTVDTGTWRRTPRRRTPVCWPLIEIVNTHAAASYAGELGATNRPGTPWSLPPRSMIRRTRTRTPALPHVVAFSMQINATHATPLTDTAYHGSTPALHSRGRPGRLEHDATRSGSVTAAASRVTPTRHS